MVDKERGSGSLQHEEKKYQAYAQRAYHYCRQHFDNAIWHLYAARTWLVGIISHSNRLSAASTLVIAVATAVNVAVAILQWRALDKTDATLHDSLIASNRAWVAPVMTQRVEPIVAGKKLTIRVIYGNPGKEPALDTNQQMVFRTGRTTLDTNSEFVAMEIEPNLTCEGLTPRQGALAVYPTAFGSSYFWTATSPFDISQDVIDRKEAIYINACFAYRTFERGHQSGFCIFLLPKLGKPPDQWEFSFCPSGNFAN
jgi:hypothetical protein